MDIKTSGTLELRDLPSIESPFFAVSKVESKIDSDIFFENKVRSRLTPFLHGGRREPIDTKELRRRFEQGDLFLVLGACDGKPFSPLVEWKATGNSPNGGHWCFTRSNSIGLSHLERQVARLNEWKITPESIKQTGPGGVGSLTATSFDMDLRQRRAEQQDQASQDADRKLTLPVGAAAMVAPLASASPSHPPDKSLDKEEKPRKPVHLEVGIFTDGTLNNAGNIEVFQQRVEKECLAPHQKGDINAAECEKRLALLLGDSYANGTSNVAKLRDLYPETDEETENTITLRRRVYAPGRGSKTGAPDSLMGSMTGLGETGVIAQVKSAFFDVARGASQLVDDGIIDALTIDLFGFSRGAAAARHAANDIVSGADGELAKAFASEGVQWPELVTIRFVGLFDTVAALQIFPMSTSHRAMIAMRP